MSTEAADPRYADIDRWPTARAIEAMIDGQAAAIVALRSQVAPIAAAADAAAHRLRRGTGRLAFAGAGTSGRIAVQDGVELVPTYNWPHDRLAFLMAGGDAALLHSVEGAEDDVAAGGDAARTARLGADDVLIGLAASGRTPFTIAVVAAARAAGALTIAIANNPATPLLAAADHAILLDTGSEPVAGSTRMNAGTAQKAALNVLSTAIMLRLGLVHRGRMVNMRLSNAKLIDRARAMVGDLAGVDEATARYALDAGGGEIRHGVLIASGASVAEAARLLATHHGHLGDALEAWRGKPTGSSTT